MIPPTTMTARRARVRGAGRVPALAAAMLILLAACGVVSTTPPAPTPADFFGISANLVRRDITVERVTSGDAGCDDQTLAHTAIGFDAKGLDQSTPIRVHVYIFRNRDAFDRLRQTVDACARSYVTDPDAFASLEASPYVVASAGPWAPQFTEAMREAFTEAAGTGG
ncbi:MAG TPA: hypothetical protein VFO73_13610 [Candidatus Limnocylindrales bacterium]|nr:hypothetical protein [Candidatus Limnocylindrales bacterium]